MASSPVSRFARGRIRELGPLLPGGGTMPIPGRLVFPDFGAESGESGSPIFGSGGAVVAIQQGGDGPGTRESSAIRVDRLRELIDFHGLGDAIDGMRGQPASRLKVPSSLDRPRLHQAVKLRAEADLLARRGNVADATRKYDEAIALAPNYTSAIQGRGRVVYSHVEGRSKELSNGDELLALAEICADMQRCCELDPLAVEGWISWLQAAVELARLKSDSELYKRCLKLSFYVLKPGTFLKGPDLEGRCTVMKTRAFCRNAMGDYSNALEDFDELIRLAPLVPRYHTLRATHHEATGRPDLALADRWLADLLGSAESAPREPGP